MLCWGGTILHVLLLKRRWLMKTVNQLIFTKTKGGRFFSDEICDISYTNIGVIIIQKVFQNCNNVKQL